MKTLCNLFGYRDFYIVVEAHICRNRDKNTFLLSRIKSNTISQD